jgi:hypothetical protein
MTRAGFAVRYGMPDLVLGKLTGHPRAIANRLAGRRRTDARRNRLRNSLSVELGEAR